MKKLTQNDLLSDKQAKLLWKIINVRGFPAAGNMTKALAWNMLKRNKAAKIKFFGTEEQKAAIDRQQKLKFLKKMKSKGLI